MRAAGDSLRVPRNWTFEGSNNNITFTILETVTSSLAALPETCANYALMYNYTEDVNDHANMFFRVLHHAIDVVKKGSATNYLKAQKEYFDRNYDWNLRKDEWTFLLNSLR